MVADKPSCAFTSVGGCADTRMLASVRRKDGGEVWLCRPHYGEVSAELAERGREPLPDWDTLGTRYALPWPGWRAVGEGVLLVALMVATLLFVMWLGLKFVEITRMTPTRMY